MKSYYKWIFLYRKITLLFFLLIFCFNKSYAYQDSSLVTIDVKNVAIENIFRIIEKQTGVVFYYSETSFNGQEQVSLKLVRAKLSKALDILLKGKNVSWIESNGGIVIRRLGSVLDQSSQIGSSGQPGDTVPKITITGIVTDVNGNPLPQSTIIIKGTGQGVNTNGEGKFVLAGVSTNATLSISSIGFEAKQVRVNGQQVINIKLNMSITDLKNVEIVSTGYQELNQSKIIGSVSKVDNVLFNRSVGSNVLERIHNITSGVLNSRVGGNNQVLTIRGKSTLLGDAEPLIVVDNFPYDGPISSLNPNDVESISVLKDAASAAIWGTKAGNGVVVITTKRGKFNSRLNVTLNANYTIRSKPDIFYIPSLGSTDMIEFEKQMFATGIYDQYDDLYPQFNYFPVLPLSVEVLLEAKRNGAANPLSDPETLKKLETLSKYDVRNDLRNEMLRNGALQQYAVNVTGGSAKFSYYGSIGYDGNKSEEARGENNRVTLNWGTSFRLLSNLEVGGQITYATSRSDQAGTNYLSFFNGVGNSPYARLIDENGNHLSIPYIYRKTYVDTAVYPALRDWRYSPLDEIDLVNSRTNNYDTRVNANVKYSILPWIKAEFQYQGQLSINQGRRNSMANSFMVRDGINSTLELNSNGQLVFPWPEGDVVEMNDSKLKSWNIRSSIVVDKKWANSKFDGLAGVEFREASQDIRFSSMYGYDPNTYTFKPVNPTQSIPTRPSGSRLIGTPINPLGTISRLGSIFSILSYSLFDRYSISASGRMDQSNNFGIKANLRKIPLWSLGLGWDIQEEAWYNVKWMDILRIRTSYGYTGNTIQGATSFATFRYLTTTNDVPPRGNLLFGEILTPNNPGLKWERAKIVNTGIDFGLFKSRINGTIEYYIKNGLDLLGDVMSEPTSGFLSFRGNNAETKGRGVDITLNTVNISKGSFEWRSRVLLSFNKTKVTSYFSPSTPTAFSIISNQYRIDYPLNSLFSYKSGGLDPLTGAPRVILGDTIAEYSLLRKAEITDVKYHGTQSPTVFGSFLNDVSWKGVSLSFNIIYRFGYYFRRSSINYSQLLGEGWSTHKDYTKRWKVKGDESSTDIPSLPDFGDEVRDRAYLLSDVLIERGDHIRLQDLRLSYSLSNHIIEKLKIKSLMVYLYASNLGIIWRANKQHIDPDAYSYGTMPLPRSYSIGFTLNY